jgi:hypothetical protein
MIDPHAAYLAGSPPALRDALLEQLATAILARREALDERKYSGDLTREIYELATAAAAMDQLVARVAQMRPPAVDVDQIAIDLWHRLQDVGQSTDVSDAAVAALRVVTGQPTP